MKHIGILLLTWLLSVTTPAVIGLNKAQYDLKEYESREVAEDYSNDEGSEDGTFFQGKDEKDVGDDVKDEQFSNNEEDDAVYIEIYQELEDNPHHRRRTKLTGYQNDMIRGGHGIVWKISRGINSAVKAVKHSFKSAVATVGRFVKEKVVPFFVNAANAIEKAAKDVLKQLGKVGKAIHSFLRCAIPGFSEIESCLIGAINSLRLCNKTSCYLKIGGKQSECLSIKSDFKYRKPCTDIMTISGDMKSRGGLSVELDIHTGDFKVSMDAVIHIHTGVNITTSRATSRHVNKRCLLSQEKQIFTHLFLIPIPLLLQIHVQPVAKINLGVTTDAQLKASVSLREAVVIKENSEFMLSPRFGFKAKYRFNKNLQMYIKKSVSLSGNAKLNGTIDTGLEITVTINGIPIKILPAIQFKITGKMYVTGPKTCYTGLLLVGVGLNVFVILDSRRFTNPGKAFNYACQTFVTLTCKYLLPISLARCISKMLFHIDPCEEVNKGCYQISKLVRKIGTPHIRSPVLKTFAIVKPRLQVVRPRLHSTC